MQNSEIETISKWKELGIFIKSRIKIPFAHPEFLGYFILVIIGFGAIGIWACFLNSNIGEDFNHGNMLVNLSTFSVAIIATGSIELMFVKDEVLKYPLLFISLTSIIITAAFFLIVFYNADNNFMYFIAVPLVVFSLLTWWIANGDNVNLTKNFFREQSQSSKDLSNSLNDYDE